MLAVAGCFTNIVLIFRNNLIKEPDLITNVKKNDKNSLESDDFRDSCGF